MKSLVEKINESLINEAKKKTVKTTVGEYVAWWFGVDNFDEIDPVDDFESTDFDPTTLETHFNNNYGAQWEFLSDHRDEKITVTQEETEYDDISVEFTVGKVTFLPVAMDFYKK
jgi:hypothetical protein